jgi:L-fuculose-phosphate aldolase
VDTDDIRFKIAAARRMLYRNGCDSGVAGHVSARDADDRDAFWVTPFEYFDETTPDRVIKVSLDLEVLEGDHEASPALQFHAAVYRERPDVGSIIHTHSHQASVFSTLGREIGMYNVLAVMLHGEQALYADDGSHPSVEGKAVAAALGTKRVLLIKGHGVLIATDTVEHATVDAMTVEAAAAYHLQCETIGGDEIPPAEVAQAKRDHDRYYRPMMWAANLRRLRRSDPDLFDALDRG